LPVCLSARTSTIFILDGFELSLQGVEMNGLSELLPDDFYILF